MVGAGSKVALPQEEVKELLSSWAPEAALPWAVASRASSSCRAGVAAIAKRGFAALRR